MLKTLKNALKVKEIRNKILFTLGVLLVYRLGAQISVPGVDAKALTNISATGLIPLLDTVSGGGLSNYSIFSMGVSPYITLKSLSNCSKWISCRSLLNGANKGKSGDAS